MRVPAKGKTFYQYLGYDSVVDVTDEVDKMAYALANPLSPEIVTASMDFSFDVYDDSIVKLPSHTKLVMKKPNMEQVIAQLDRYKFIKINQFGYYKLLQTPPIIPPPLIAPPILSKQIFAPLVKTALKRNIYTYAITTIGMALLTQAVPTRRTYAVGLRQLNGIFKSTLDGAKQSVIPDLQVDTSAFEKALSRYSAYSKKNAIDIVNNKAYFVAINAIKNTYKADINTIKANLNKPSDKFKNLTIAETIALRQAQIEKKKLTKTELKQNARKIISSKASSVGFLRSGWLPAIRELAKYVNKKAVRSKRRGKDKGGVSPAKIKNHVAIAEIWNSIIAENDPKAKAYMRVGLQIALNKEAANMMQYVARKQQQLNNNFNNNKL